MVTNDNQNILQGLGYKGTSLIAALSEAKKRIFTVEDARRILGGKPVSVNSLLRKLVNGKKIIRLERGKFLITPPESWRQGDYLEQGITLAANLISPYYLSFWTALNYYGYTEQSSKTIFVVTERTKKALKIGGIRFQFVKFLPEKFFGFEKVWFDNQQVNMADREKMIVDCLDQPRYCGEITEVAKVLWNGQKEIDLDKLVAYSNRMNNFAIAKRLGFLLEILKLGSSQIIKNLQSKISQGYSLLEPFGSKTGNYNSRWKLLVNVDPKHLTEWINH